MAGLLENWGFLPEGGGLLGNFANNMNNNLNNSMNNPLFMMGLGLASDRDPGRGISNAMNAMLLQRAFSTQRDDKKKAEDRDLRDYNLRTAEAKRQADQFSQTHALAQQQANKPQVVGSEQSGYWVVNPNDLRAQGSGAPQQAVPGVAQAGQAPTPAPGAPSLARPLIPPTPRAFPAADKKAIFEAEDSSAQLKGTLDTLNRARDLNRQTFTGYTAGARGWAGTALPDYLVPDVVADPKTAASTREFNQIMSQEAIKSMSETLKGATTDREMARFTEILADPTTPPEIRERTIERMIGLAQRQQELNARRMTDLRKGEYFRPETQGQAPAQTQPSDLPRAGGQLDTQGGLPKLSSESQFKALPSGTRFIAPDGTVRVKP